MPVTYAPVKKNFLTRGTVSPALPVFQGLFPWGDPIYVPPDLRGADLEAKRQEIEAILVSLTETAEPHGSGD